MYLGFSEEDRITIGNNLKEIRVEKNILQRQVENDLHIGANTLTRLENGKEKFLSALDLEPFADYYNVPVIRLLNGVHSELVKDLKYKYSNYIYVDLPDEAQEYIDIIMIREWVKAYPDQELTQSQKDRLIQYHKGMLEKLKI